MTEESKLFDTNPSRREFLRTAGMTVVASAFRSVRGQQEIQHGTRDQPSEVEAARGVLSNLLGPAAEQIQLRLIAPGAAEAFAISDAEPGVLVEGTSLPSLLAGVNWYLRYVVNVSITWNGDSLAMLPKRLPSPLERIERETTVPHRFALNDTNDAYTGPYWQWSQWKRFLNVLALHGINEVLVYMGAEAVYQQTFQEFGYAADELRHWFPMPAHQPWWLLQNMAGSNGATVSQHLLESRLTLGRRICDYLRSLDITPVLPGYCGTVPDGFAERQPGARVLQQGKWLNLKRPDWLDPTTEKFAEVASRYYAIQERLLGPSTMFKMDPLHEGGRDSGIDVSAAAGGIERALEAGRPGATWAILAWQDNPRADLLAGIKNKERVLLLDGVSDRYPFVDRNKQWSGFPYAFGSIWNFGGHTTMGANMSVWNERYFQLLSSTSSTLRGIAIMPEASCNNSVAFEFLAELPWHQKPVNLPAWFNAWSIYRYGRKDGNAAMAWNVLRQTAYATPADSWSESHDNLFSAQPDLDVRGAAHWSPQDARYDLQQFAQALKPLLSASAELRTTSAYRYDLVDVARQVIANRSRVMLPKINSAYKGANLPQFRALTLTWLEHILILDKVVSTEGSLLLGRWLADARSWAKGENGHAGMEFDMKSLLVEWGPVETANADIHDYANREWNGLLSFYHDRWQRYFSMLDAHLAGTSPLLRMDWFAMADTWAKGGGVLPEDPIGEAYATVAGVWSKLALDS